MHETIIRMQEVVAKGDDSKIAELLAEDVRFMPPTYFATWTGRAPVAAVLGHVGKVFSDFKYRRVMGDGQRLGVGVPMQDRRSGRRGGGSDHAE